MVFNKLILCFHKYISVSP